MDFSFNHNKENNLVDFLNSKILIIGKRGTGKTNVVRSLYSYIQNNIDEIHVFSNVTSFYTDITNAIYNDYSLLTEFAEYCQHHHDTHKLLIVENLCEKKQFELLDEFLYNGSAYNVTLIVTLQTPTGFKPLERDMFNYVFTAQENFYSNRQKLHSYYFGMYPTLNQFNESMDHLVEFEFLVSIHRKTVMKFKADIENHVQYKHTHQIEKIHHNDKEIFVKKMNHIIELLIELRDSIK
ncbi:VV A32-like packaging ATPase [Fadolivirus algeromassiliense]|jgi:hypothetical protein|uniref:VV A32-like packaging ATPase n=1 Tax=Fadolivirus FV1/VV64 TaxID=3070911 RepID=A0A7D3QXL5_9VIRU|nr:VV A32-like packaging ATPase [Fadolivirus algeromassiliense]QKF94580.1 VV A32-like packaging ATPase [Fadolivirus FV1/VV64]